MIDEEVEKLIPSILKVENLKINFGKGAVVKEVGFEMQKGEILGIVGESGSGKTVSVRGIMQLVGPPGEIERGEAIFQSQQLHSVNLLQLSSEKIRKIRGKEVGMIFQEPGRALNPVFRCGTQMVEVLKLHQKLKGQEAKSRALVLFEEVGLNDVERMFQSYPHQLSGGQKQRIMIALALGGEPQLLIADEPTTSLDVEVQERIITLLKSLRQNHHLSQIIISHDLTLLAKIADRLLVMKNGEVVETGDTQELLNNPQHPYTQALLACRPSLHELHHRLLTLEDFEKKEGAKAKVVSSNAIEERGQKLYEQKPLWEVKSLSTHFRVKERPLSLKRRILKAVDDVSFEIYPGETLGLVGESGSGKTTLGRSILRLEEPTSGELFFEGENLLKHSSGVLRKLRQRMQIIFQDPYNSLNPRIKIGDAIEEPMKVHGIIKHARERKEVALSLLKTVGLKEEHYDRYPHAFSGGERQRISIARALSLNPRFIICDECVSSLDVSIQAHILNLLKNLQEEKGLTYLFISHDLRVVRQMCDRIMVMKNGKIVEIGKTEELIRNPQHEYTQRLIRAGE